MSDETLRKMRDLDEAAESAGGFVAPFVKDDTHYDYRKISEYCKSKGIVPLDLTLRELNDFVIRNS